MPIYDFRCADGHVFERFVKLVHFDEAQRCECGQHAHRLLSAPRIRSDQIEPCMGADGRMHDSLSSLRHSYTPEGNPQGERYLEIGDAELPHIEQKFDRKQRRDDIKAAIEDVKNGRVAPLTVLED